MIKLINYVNRGVILFHSAVVRKASELGQGKFLAPSHMELYFSKAAWPFRVQF